MNSEIKVIAERAVLGQAFRMYGTFENPLFLAKDVAEWIEHSDVSTMLRSIDVEEKGTNNVCTLGGNQKSWFLTEDGLYEVLMQSRKPIAKQFKKQVKLILKELRQKGYVDLRNQDKIKAQLAEAKLKNAKAREASLLFKIAQQVPNETYKQVLQSHITELLTGQKLLPLPTIEAKTYSAEEVGNMLGISKNMVGRLTNEHGLKTDKYGTWVWDKAKGHDKQVQTFRYYIGIVDVLRAIIAEVA